MTSPEDQATGPPPAKESSRFWGLWETRVGVIGGVAGLVTLALGLPAQVKDAFTDPQAGATAVEVATARAALADAGPRIEVRYEFIDAGITGIDLADPRDVSPRPTAAATIRSYPIIENEITARFGSGSAQDDGCGSRDYPSRTIVFLVVTNRGRRDAADLRIGVRKLKLPVPVAIRAAGTGAQEPLRRLAAHARGVESVRIDYPESLGPGEGLRVPLFASLARDERAAVSCVVSTVAFDPRTIAFSDPSLGTKPSLTVRRMKSPTRLEDGILIRG